MKAFLAQYWNAFRGLQGCQTPGQPGIGEFSGLNPTAHLLVCLRINPAVTDETARLTADLPGSALIGRDLHPQDDDSEFHKVTVTSLLSDQKSLVATGTLTLRRNRTNLLG